MKRIVVIIVMSLLGGLFISNAYPHEKKTGIGLKFGGGLEFGGIQGTFRIDREWSFVLGIGKGLSLKADNDYGTGYEGPSLEEVPTAFMIGFKYKFNNKFYLLSGANIKIRKIEASSGNDGWFTDNLDKERNEIWVDRGGVPAGTPAHKLSFNMTSVGIPIFFGWETKNDDGFFLNLEAGLITYYISRTKEKINDTLKLKVRSPRTGFSIGITFGKYF